MIELLFACFKAGMIAVPVRGELQQHAVQSLADFKVPEKIMFVPSLPKGVTGKIQRRALKEMSSNKVVNKQNPIARLAAALIRKR